MSNSENLIMCDFNGNIPQVPEPPNIIYSNPYKPPEYKLNGFTIDYEDFHVNKETKNNKESEAKELEELEQKYSKIQELIRLKTLEKIIDERKKIEEDLNSITESIYELFSYTTDLTSLLFNHQNQSELNALYDKLNSIIINQKELELSGEDENIRCEEIKNVLSSIKACPIDTTPKATQKKGKHVKRSKK